MQSPGIGCVQPLYLVVHTIPSVLLERLCTVPTTPLEELCVGPDIPLEGILTASTIPHSNVQPLQSP